MASPNTNPQHYWLIAGHVMVADQKDNVMPIQLNVMSRTNAKRFNHADIAKAQQGLQHRFFQQAGGVPTDLKVVDVFLLSINYLGHMTEKEFNKGSPAQQVDDVVEEKVIN